MNAKEECQCYIDKIFLSIKKDVHALDDEKLLQGFLEYINKFYTPCLCKIWVGLLLAEFK